MNDFTKLTRDDILEAIRKCDDAGVPAFLAEHGFGPSKKYQIRHNGRSYPSKAIVGVAANLGPREFFGGIAQTLPILKRLGFVVRDGKRVVEKAGFAATEAMGLKGVPALPCKKAATTSEEAAAFVAEIKPAHVHLLGLGVRNRKASEYLEGIKGTSVSLDSNWICANVGRKPKPRAYTRARDVAKNFVASPAAVAEFAIVVAFGLAGVLY